MAQRSSVAITIVTFNSSPYIRRCLEHALHQDYENLSLVVVDNASSDNTAEILREFEGHARIVYNAKNMGFAGGQNQAMGLVDAAWYLTLNPDVKLTTGFVSQLVSAGESNAGIGSVCGKLLAMTPEFQPQEPSIFDSTGIYVTPNMRHFDRGSLQPDQHQYDLPQFVFGATGAACLYRREMIRDISINGEFFDDDLFRLSRRRRCGMAGAVAGLEMPLCSECSGISCAKCFTLEPS